MSFPKAKRFTEHASQGPGPNAYDVVFTGSDRLVRDHLQFNSAQPNKPVSEKILLGEQLRYYNVDEKHPGCINSKSSLS